ncbi:MAG TPA: exodeoxyribonuclease III [Acidimicrobiia bacterium]|nr:exodeoxyribonuclease III [Acidimicrobiia bacterium]HIL06207.1 exodeoxyribonuclease III [Acidimicrobiia bacterium]
MRIATWNVNSLNARTERVDEWLDYACPDVLLLQETKMSDEQFPHDHYSRQGYESVHCGEGRWNGVAILSRVGIEDPLMGFADGEDADPEARIISGTCGGVRVSSVYVPNGRAVDHDHYQYKLRWLSRLRKHLDMSCDPDGWVLVGGDYNICPDDRDVWDPANPAPRTHVTPKERAALAKLMDWGLVDVFRKFYEDEGLYSWWDYRDGAFHKKMGLRIDLLMASQALAERAMFCLVDRTARKGTKPSDHAPVYVDIDC